MKRKYRLFLALNGVMRRKKAWARTIAATAIALTLLISAGTMLHSVNFFLNDYMIGAPCTRGIEIGVPGESAEEVWRLIHRAEKDPRIAAAYSPLLPGGAKIENPQKLFAGEGLDTQSHGFGTVMAEHDRYFDARYLKSGRWIRPGEKNVMVIPEHFAPNLEGDDGDWNFRQKYAEGRKYIGKTIMLTSMSEGGKYPAKVIGTYDNLRSGTQSGTVIFPFEDAQKFQSRQDGTETDPYVYFHLIVKEKEDVPEVMDMLDRKLIEFERFIERMSSPGTLETFADIAGFSGIALSLFFAVLAVILTHSGYEGILDSKMAELGLYRAVGYTQKEIKRTLLWEILLIGAGMLLIAIAASGVLLGIAYGVIKLQGSLLVASIPMRPSLPALAAGAILCVGVPLLGAGNAIRRLEEREIAVSLKGD